MRRAIPLILLVCALTGAACSRQTAGTGGPVTRVMFTMRDTSRSWTADSTRDPEEVSVAFSWPRFTAAPGPAAVDSLNAFVRGALVAPYVRSGAYASLDSLMDEFIADYRRYRHDFPHAPSGWYLKRTIEVVGDTASVVSLSLYEESFGGGAHPNAATRLLCFDSHSGRRLNLADLIATADRDSLERLAEAEFRRVRQLAPEAPLAAAGFWFKGNRFRLNDNFAVTRRGLEFLYNDYEIGPHSLGPTRIELDWSALRGLIAPGGPLGTLAARRA